MRHETHDVQSVALSPEPEVTFAEIAVSSSPKNIVDQTMTDSVTSFCPDAVIRTCTLTIEVSNHASREVLSLIRSVMKMLRDVYNLQKIYIACDSTDLRKGIDGLAALVKEHFQLDPFQKDVLWIRWSVQTL